MDFDTAKMLAIGGVVPGVVSLAVWFLLWRSEKGEHASAARHAMGSFMFAVLAIASQCVFVAVPNWPIKEAADQLSLAIGAWFVVSLVFLFRTPESFRIAVSAMAGLAIALGATAQLANRNDPSTLWAIAIMVIASAIAPSAITRVATSLDRRAGILVTLAWVATASQAAVLVFHAMKLGQFVGFAAAVTGGALLVSFVRRSLSFGRGLAVVPIGMTLAGTFHGVVFGDTERPLVSEALVFTGPALAWACVPLVRKLPGWARAGIAVALVILPAAAAIALVVLAKPAMAE